MQCGRHFDRRRRESGCLSVFQSVDAHVVKVGEGGLGWVRGIIRARVEPHYSSRISKVFITNLAPRLKKTPSLWYPR